MLSNGARLTQLSGFFSCLSMSLDFVILTRISEFMMHSNKSSIEFFGLH